MGGLTPPPRPHRLGAAQSGGGRFPGTNGLGRWNYPVLPDGGYPPGGGRLASCDRWIRQEETYGHLGNRVATVGNLRFAEPANVRDVAAGIRSGSGVGVRDAADRPPRRPGD